MTYATADLSDANPEAQVCEPLFRAHGGRPSFWGPIVTLKVFEDNAMVREAVEQPGEGRVLVVDGGGSVRCALLGGNLAVLAAEEGADVVACDYSPSQVELGRARTEREGVDVEWDDAGKLVPVHYELYLRWTRRRAGERGLPEPIALRLARRREPLERFEAVARRFGERVVRVDASGSREEVARRVREALGA
jgi:hypothetical protein